MKKTYTDILANAFSEVRAWKLTTLSLAALCAVLVIALIFQASSTPIVLVPYGVAAEQTRMKVSPGGDFANTSPDPRWALICCYNTRSNNPYKDSRHPRYAFLEKWPDERVKEIGRRDIARFVD